MTEHDCAELDPRGWVTAKNQQCQVYVRNAWRDDFISATWKGECVEGKAEGDGLLVALWARPNGPDRALRYKGLMRGGQERDPGVTTVGPAKEEDAPPQEPASGAGLKVIEGAKEDG